MHIQKPNKKIFGKINNRINRVKFFKESNKLNEKDFIQHFYVAIGTKKKYQKL